MAEMLTTPQTNGVPVRAEQASTRAKEQALARTLESKLAQGYRIESQSADRAVLTTRGRSRWFGLSHGPEARFEVTVDERGQARSRRL